MSITYFLLRTMKTNPSPSHLLVNEVLEISIWLDEQSFGLHAHKFSGKSKCMLIYIHVQCIPKRFNELVQNNTYVEEDYVLNNK